jgi:DNA adenine methylase
MYDPEAQPQLPDPRPVISWPGGKTRLLKYLLPLIPAHLLYGEPFGGGLAVLLAKPRSEVEVVNDINGELVSFYRCAKYHLESLLDELDLVMNARQEFQDYLAQPGLTEIQRAARWFIRNRISFGGMGVTFAVSRSHPMSSRAQRLIAIRALNRRFDRVTIERLSWEKFFELYDCEQGFFFLDPPYLDGAGAAYAGWSEHELQRFGTRVQTLRGKWLLTFQDCPQVREIFAGYNLRAITRANGIGNNTGKRGRIYREVIITSERSARAGDRKGRVA